MKTSRDKAAALLVSLGEDLAGEVMKFLKPGEIQKVTSSMVRLESLTREELGEVIDEYTQIVEENPVVGADGGRYIQAVLEKTLGKESADEIMENFLFSGADEGVDAIRRMDARTISDIVKREHPQVVAFVLATLDAGKASQVLEYLPERTQSEVVYRISTMEEIHPNVLTELEEAMRSHVSESSARSGFNLGGIKYAAEILNRMEPTVERNILEEIRRIEEPVSEKIEEQLFVFEDLGALDDRTLRTVLQEIGTDLLAVAMRGVDDSLKDKFFDNMTQRAAAILKEEIEMMGPVRLKDVEKSQQEVVKIVKKLEQQGKIQLAAGAEDVFV